MTRDLLVRGMLVGLLAGILCFGFLKIFGEPSVDRAIAFEARTGEAHDHGHDHAEAHGDTAMGTTPLPEVPQPELVSRSVQGGIGLFTGVAVYSAAFGGLFSLAFAFVYGRMGQHGARATAAVLAAAGFIALYVVPTIKYPANPPAANDAETIRIRTTLYFIMIAISVAAMIGAVILRNRTVARRGSWNAALLGAAAYLVVVCVAGLALPGVHEIPEAFPATVLWDFRVAAIGAQLIMWTTLGLGFGAVAERTLAGRRQWRLETA